MAYGIVKTEELSDIADAIRAKLGVQTQYKPGQMADAIESISGGGITPTGTKSITENGTYDVSEFASANVNVPTGITPTGTKQISVTSNGTTTEDVTNYASVEINTNVVNQDYEDALVALGVQSDLTDGIEALTTYANGVTGESDSNLSDAVHTLGSGYGGGSGGIENGLVFESLDANYNPTKIKVYGENVGSIFDNAINNNTVGIGAFVEEVELVDAISLQTAFFRTAKVGGTATPTLKKVTGDNVVTVGSNVFQGNTELENVFLPSLENMFIAPSSSIVSQTNNNYAGSEFSGCTSLETISLPKCKNINRNTFNGCTALKNVYLPSCTLIVSRDTNNAPFKGCTALQTVQLGDIGHGITRLDATSFSGCTQSGLTITAYTNGSYASTLLSNIRNGATNATIIIKASEATTYNGVSYSAGDTITV